MDKSKITLFLNGIAKELKLRTYGKATVHATGKIGKKVNQGYDAFVPLIDSGISLYVWGSSNFFSTIIYTCKKFDNKKAIAYTKKFFKCKNAVYESF